MTKTKKLIETLTAERDALIETAKRAMADLDNAKKRMEEERLTVGAFAKAEIMASLLLILDNFRRAIKNLPQENEWAKGILHIEKQFEETLKKHGLTPIENVVGQPFNPEQHEAITQGPGEKDIILEELERGYFFQGRILRPAKVKVGNGENAQENTEVADIDKK